MTSEIDTPAPSRLPAVPDDPLSQIYARDPRAEGRFWYSVVTTGVYCRPTCPARRARPENIRIHATLADARATGFRACARCRPEDPSLQDHHKALIAEACARLDAAGPSLATKDLAKALGLSPSYFLKLFRRFTGTTPSSYGLRGRGRPQGSMDAASDPTRGRSSERRTLGESSEGSIR